MVEEHPEEVEAAQHQLQEILLSVARTHTRAPVGDVREVLRRAIEAAGIPEQPKKWVVDAAAEISAGRLLVMNAHEEHELHVGIRGQSTGGGERVAQAVTDEGRGGGDAGAARTTSAASGSAAASDTRAGEVLPDERRHP